MRLLATLGVCLCCLPTAAHAAVVINEIAWAGDSASANNEWIELHNTGSTVSLDGWQLSDGINLTIDLFGSLTGGAYGVLERTDDDSSPGTAFLIYTGALSNAGATLTLRRADGSIEDRVAGGENWESVGGDNDTKDTAQLTDGGWITAESTPGKVNATEASVEPAETTSQSTKTTSVQTTPVNRSRTEALQLPDVDLRLAVDVPEMLYVNQPVTFAVDPAGLGAVLLESLVYDWNFGDLTVGNGQTVTHTYGVPGEYVVSVRAAYARHEQIAKFSVSVLPMPVTLETTATGEYRLRNNARYEVDVSGYTLYGTKGVTFPERTYLAPSATLVIPRDRIRAYSPLGAKLFDRHNTVVASAGAPSVLAQPPSEPEVLTAAVPTTVVRAPVFATPELAVQNDSAPPTTTPTVETRAVPPTVPNLVAVADAPLVPSSTWPYVGLFGLLSLGLLTIVATRRQ